MREKITLNVNGQQHLVEVDPETPLLFVLNDELELRGPRFGCGMAQCGACTPGMLVTATALLETNPAPSENDVMDAGNGHTQSLRQVIRGHLEWL